MRTARSTSEAAAALRAALRFSSAKVSLRANRPPSSARTSRSFSAAGRTRLSCCSRACAVALWSEARDRPIRRLRVSLFRGLRGLEKPAGSLRQNLPADRAERRPERRAPRVMAREVVTLSRRGVPVDRFFGVLDPCLRILDAFREDGRSLNRQRDVVEIRDAVDGVGQPRPDHGQASEPVDPQASAQRGPNRRDGARRSLSLPEYSRGAVCHTIGFRLDQNKCRTTDLWISDRPRRAGNSSRDSFTTSRHRCPRSPFIWREPTARRGAARTPPNLWRSPAAS